MRRGTTTENLSLLRERLAGIEITIVAEVGSIDITIRDVLALRAGDIIRLQNMRVSDPMALKIGDRKKFLCRPGVVGNKIAVQVLQEARGHRTGGVRGVRRGRGRRSMSDGSLSQDEIDALLQGTDTIEMDTGSAGGAAPLTDAEKTVFQEMLRGVTESQSSNLSILTGKTVRIGDPVVKARAPGDLTAALPEEGRGRARRHDRRAAGRALLRHPRGGRGGHRGAHDGAGGRRDRRCLALGRLGGHVPITRTAATAIGNQIGRIVKTAVPDPRQAVKSQVRVPQGEFCVSAEYPLSIEGSPPSRMFGLCSPCPS